MSDIFISYARDDRERIVALAGALERAGFSVWWDRHIAGGAAFSEEIVRELKAADAVIVAWSGAAIKSRWVMDEAATAADAGKLIPIALDSAETPMGFKQLQVIDFGDWDGADEAPAIEAVVNAVKRRQDPQHQYVPAPEAAPLAKTPSRLPLMIAAGLVALVAIGAVVMMRTGAPVSTPAASGEGGEAGQATQQVTDASIAVLPFADMSEAGDQEYFADGISEELLNVLARVDDLKVAGRTSSFAFKGRNEDLRKIGEILGVAHILEGSVRKSGDRVRVTAQLIKADDGFHLWSETFDRELDDIFAVQDEIAAEIVTALSARLSGSAPQTARTDVGAYGLYLEAKQLISERRAVSLEHAEELLGRAIAIDPDYAPAYASRAFTEILLSDAPGAYGRRPAAEALVRAEAFANRALALDAEIADAHAAAGLIYMNTGNAEAAVVSLKKAVEINPNHLNARNWLSLTLGSTGRYADRAEQTLKLFELDPLYRPGANNTIVNLLEIGDLETARNVIERIREVDPGGELYAWSRSSLLAAEGKNAEAIRIGTPVYEKLPDTTRGGGLGFSHITIGDFKGAKKYDFPFLAIYGLIAEGKTDEAVDIAKHELDKSPDFYAARIDYINALHAARRHDELLQYYRELWNDPADFESDLFQIATADLPPFGALAFALREAGEIDEFEAVMTRWRRAIDISRAGGANDPSWDREDAVWHALSGNEDEALDWLEKSASWTSGLLFYGFERSPVIAELSASPRFEKLAMRNRERINEERSALGLDPL